MADGHTISGPEGDATMIPPLGDRGISEGIFRHIPQSDTICT